MTKRKAEALTGYEIRRIPSERNRFCFGAFDRDELIAEAGHQTERIALTWLVNSVYKLHSRQVLDHYGWRCARCGSTYLLQVHHRKFRSHGGTHRPENLEPTCGDCHRAIHAHTAVGVDVSDGIGLTPS
jgi:5-methylcytosine-specific restriction endonuclease McrA